MDTKRCPYCSEEILAVAKKCKHCGKWLTEQAVSENIPETPSTVHNNNSDSKAASGWFMHYFVNVIRFQYADFKGTATRKEYGIFNLCIYLLMFPLLLLIFTSLELAKSFTNNTIVLVIALSLYGVFLAFLVPFFAITFRRSHDIDISGWWMLIGPVPIIGTIWALGLLCIKGETANKRGSSSTSEIIIIVANILLTLGAQAYAYFGPQ